jgi:DNA mismatch repair protein MutS2
MRLLAARHPLLVKGQREGKTDKVIPITLKLDQDCRVLVVSGANTGGKTAALKTLGLLSVMAQAGLHIPANPDSETNLFRDVFAYIGDEQNIQENLSTFSSFVLWLNGVLEHVDAGSLLLIDEIGAGTEYFQGATLAMGLLDYVRARGGYAVVTTHSNHLKAYAVQHADVINVAVEFDRDTLRPTYRLLYGVPGTSQTFLIAERLGLDAGIVDRAKTYQQGTQGRVDDLIDELGELTTDLERSKEETEKVRTEAYKERETLQRKVRELQEKREQVLKKTEEEGKRIITSLQTRLKRILKRAEIESDRAATLKGEFARIAKEEFSGRLARKRRSRHDEAVAVGDRVEVLSLGKEGVVTALSKDPSRTSITVGGMRVNASRKDLRLIATEARERDPGEGLYYRVTRHPSSETDRGEINVVGLRVEEAIPKVDKFIDDAILNGWEHVQIIHGIGTGRLREAIQGYLQGHQGVKDVKTAGLEDGGGAITVVSLR